MEYSGTNQTYGCYSNLKKYGACGENVKIRPPVPVTTNPTAFMVGVKLPVHLPPTVPKQNSKRCNIYQVHNFN